MTILSLVSVLLPGAMASRNAEGAALLQTGQVQAHLLEMGSVGRGNLAGMKDQILAFADAGVPEAAIPLLQQIKITLNTSVLDAIKNETDGAKSLDTTLRKKFTDATTDFTNAKTAQDTAKDTTVPGLRSTHITCRNDQKTLNETHNSCVNGLGTARSQYATSHGNAMSAHSALTTGAAADADSDSACTTGITWRNQPDGSLDAMSSALDTYKSAIDDLKSKRTTFDNKLADCGYSDSKLKSDGFKVSAVQPWIGKLKAVHDKIALCNTAQTNYETDACSLSRALATANSDYNSAWNTATASYNAQKLVWQVETTNRFHQCQLVHTLICYVDGLIKNDPKSALQSAIGNCDTVAESYDAANKADRAYNEACAIYEFAPGILPTPDDDVIVPASPCGAGWDYGVTHGAIAPNAACTACSPAIGASEPVAPPPPPAPVPWDAAWSTTIAGSVQATPAYWQELCDEIAGVAPEANAIKINLNPGHDDYYKPIEGKTLCEMLTMVDGNIHLWSRNGVDWETPPYYMTNGHLGGSSSYDGRSYLPFWGDDDTGLGGCCNPSWGSEFTVTAAVV